MRLWRKLVVALTGFVLLLSGTLVSADTANTTIYVDRNHSAASDSNAGTSASSPLRTVSRALEIAVKNKNKDISTRVLIAPGTYRESIWLWGSMNEASVSIEAQQPGTVIWSGAENWSDGWQKDGSEWVHSWDYDWGQQKNPWERFGEWAYMPDVIRRREMFTVNGTPLRQVLSRNEMEAGTFFVNENSNKVFIQLPAGVNMQNASIKASVLPYLLQVYNMKNFSISGITFQEAATYAGETTVQLFMSDNVTITDSRFLYNNWGGLQTWDVHNLTLRDIEASYNGVSGFVITQVSNLVMENVDSSYNNWRGLWGDWHGWADGSKLSAIHGGSITNFHAVGNDAFGLWLDYDNVDVVVENSYFENNLTGGLYIEASQGPVTVRNSVFINNGDKDHNNNGGLFSSGSNNVTAQCNYLRGNSSNQFRIREGRADVWDWETDANIKLTLSGWKISQNVVIGEQNDQYLIQYPDRSFGDVSGTEMSENVWWHEARNDGFRIVGSPAITFEEFRQYVNDGSSVYAPPESLDDFTSNCSNPFIQAMMSTPEPTLTATYTPSPTNTMTYTPSPTNTMTYTPSPTNTMTYTPSPTNTMTYTPSPTNTMTYTPSPTNTMTYTPSPTNTMTYTPSPTDTPTFTPTATEDTLVDNPVSSQGTDACAASRVVSYAPGLRKNDSLVPLSVANPVKALGMAQNDDTANYVALGFGGALILEFTPNVIVNLPGDDIRVVETTPDDLEDIWENYPEQAMVYASQDGEDWKYLGMNRKDMTFDLGTMDWARYIKLVDASNPDLFADKNSDAFDVDAVEMTFCGTDMVDNPDTPNTPVPPPDNSSTGGGDDPIVTNPEPTADSGDGGLISNPAGGVALELLPVCPRGQFVVNNGNDFAVSYTWDIPNTSISGSGTVQAHQERYINTDDVNATIRLFVNANQVATAASVANCPPEAINDSATTPLDTPITIPVLVNDSDSDGDALTINALSQPASGSVSANANGTVTFVPPAGFTGQTTFQYQITDGISQPDAVAVVTVTVGDSDSGSTVCDDPNPARDLKHDQSFLYGDNKDSGQVTNLSNACSYNIGMASYKMFENSTDTQEIFDFMTLTIGPGETVHTHVSLPSCATQVDLFYGPVLMSLFHQRYGDRLIEGAYLGWGEWCEGGNTDGDQTAAAAETPANNSTAVPSPETTAEPTATTTETSVPAEDATTAADAETPVEEPVVDDPAPVEEPVVEEPTPSPSPQPVVEEPTTVPTVEPTTVPPTTVPPTAIPPTTVPTVAPTAVPPTAVPTAVPTNPPEPTAVLETENQSPPAEPTGEPTQVADSGQ